MRTGLCFVLLLFVLSAVSSVKAVSTGDRTVFGRVVLIKYDRLYIDFDTVAANPGTMLQLAGPRACAAQTTLMIEHFIHGLAITVADTGIARCVKVGDLVTHKPSHLIQSRLLALLIPNLKDSTTFSRELSAVLYSRLVNKASSLLSNETRLPLDPTDAMLPVISARPATERQLTRMLNQLRKSNSRIRIFITDRQLQDVSDYIDDYLSREQFSVETVTNPSNAHIAIRYVRLQSDGVSCRNVETIIHKLAADTVASSRSATSLRLAQFYTEGCEHSFVSRAFELLTDDLRVLPLFYIEGTPEQVPAESTLVPAEFLNK